MSANCEIMNRPSYRNPEIKIALATKMTWICNGVSAGFLKLSYEMYQRLEYSDFFFFDIMVMELHAHVE